MITQLGRTLSFVGGNVTVTGGGPTTITLLAPGGRIQISSVLEGEVPLTGDFNVSSVNRLGQINITNANLTVSGNPGGTIVIRGGQLIVDRSHFDNTTGNLPVPQNGIDIQVAGDLVLKNGTAITTIGSSTKAGNVAVTGESVTLSGSKLVSTGGALSGSAGDITLEVGNLTLTDGAAIQSGSVISAQNQQVGNVNINARDSILVASGSTISNQTARADVGRVEISAQNLTVDNGIVSASTVDRGHAGDISVNLRGDLILTNGGKIVSSTGLGTSGDGGTLNLKADESIFISGKSATDPPIGFGVTDRSSGLFSTTAKDSTGNAGQINLTTPTLIMDDGGKISVATAGRGAAGSIGLNVNKLSITGGARVDSGTTAAGQGGDISITAIESASISGQGTGLFSTASGTGDAGKISVSAPSLAPLPSFTISDGGKISVATTGTMPNAGNAGSVLLNANNFSLTGGAQVVSSTDGTGQGGSLGITAANSTSISGNKSGLLSTASSSGNAGQINLTTPTLAMNDGGTISVATSGAGNAGNIALNVANFTQTGGARVDSSTSSGGKGGDLTVTAANSATISDSGTGLFTTASGTGAGGDIKIQAGKLVQLSNAGTISAQSTGTATATAGDININTPTFQSQNSSVTTGATLADGGNISIITTGSLVDLTDSQITTSVQGGVGNGGNITINSDHIVLNDSQILAQAVRGHGGNINITGDVFLVNSNGQFPISLTGIVDASSELITPGTVNNEATFTNVVGTFNQLPSTPLQATELLRASCAARFSGGKTSSLVLGGRDGLPLEPGGLLPSPLYSGVLPTDISGIRRFADEDHNRSRFALLRTGTERLQLGTGWDKFRLTKGIYGFGCSK